MRTRRLWSASLASLCLALWSAGAGWALERQLVGIVLGRSYKTVLAKYGNPDLMIPVTLPTAGSFLAAGGLGSEGGFGAAGGFGAPGGGYGAPGGSSPYGPPGMGGPGMPGGSPGYGPPSMPGSGPGMMPGGGGGGYGPPSMPGSGPGGPPGMSGPGGPPVLPPGGGYGGGPGYGAPGGMGGYGGGDGTTTGGVLAQGNAVEWVYLRPGGASLEFWINEDGRVAQIAATGRTGNAVTSKGIRLGSGYPQVLKSYGMAELHRYSTVPPEMARIMGLGQADKKSRGQRGSNKTGMSQFFGVAFQAANLVTDVIYTKSHHAAFTLVDGKVARITIALAD